MMFINLCTGPEHFEANGNLSAKGKAIFWEELDELLRKFEFGILKLLPKTHMNKCHHKSDGFEYRHSSSRQPVCSEVHVVNRTHRFTNHIHKETRHSSYADSNPFISAVTGCDYRLKTSDRRFVLPRPHSGFNY